MKLIYPFALMMSAVWLLAAQTYSLHTEQRVPVGQTYAFSATGFSGQFLSSGDRTLQADEFRVTFEGQARVMEVDKSGQPYKLSFTVQKFTRTQNGTNVDLLPSGSVLLADGGQHEHYWLSHGLLDKETEEAFAILYSAHQPDLYSADEIFGTNQARAVGETWPIDGARALKILEKGMQETGFPFTADQLTGTVRFTAVEKVAGSDCAQLDAQITVGNFTTKKLSPGIVVNNGTFQGEFSGCFPFEKSAQSFREGQNLHARVAATGPHGQQVEVTTDRKMEGTWLASGEK